MFVFITLSSYHKLHSFEQIIIVSIWFPINRKKITAVFALSLIWIGSLSLDRAVIGQSRELGWL